MGDRHGRQSRLAGIGADGQARIGRASVEVHLDGLAGEVAARYLAGAGVGALTVRSEAVAAAARAADARAAVVVDASPGPEVGAAPAAPGGATAAAREGGSHEVPDLDDAAARDLEDAAAGDVLEGARFALRAIKRALEAAE